jgi:non-ribosomal peptide synthase protein (TIGR01720 family)
VLAERASSVETGEWFDVVSRPGAVLPTKGAPSSTLAISSVLDAATTTTLIRETPKWHVSIDELLVTALVLALSEWTGGHDVRVMMESHGRQSDDPAVDVTRTVGWFTAMFPVVVEISRGRAPAYILGSVKETVRHGLDHGMEYGVLRYLHTSDDVRRALALESGTHALFRYLGRHDGGAINGARFRMARPIEISRADDAHPVFGLEVSAWLTSEHLSIDWSFAEGRLDTGVVERLAQRCIEHLAALMDECAAGAPGVTSASDFPHANLDEEGLAKLALLLDRKNGEG